VVHLIVEASLSTSQKKTLLLCAQQNLPAPSNQLQPPISPRQLPIIDRFTVHATMPNAWQTSALQFAPNSSLDISTSHPMNNPIIHLFLVHPSLISASEYSTAAAGGGEIYS
jgi:hypothetical protein